MKGRKTYESIGRCLPGRVNVIVTKQTNYSLQNATIVHSLEDAIQCAKSTGDTEAIIIGGGFHFKHIHKHAKNIILILA